MKLNLFFPKTFFLCCFYFCNIYFAIADGNDKTQALQKEMAIKQNYFFVPNLGQVFTNNGSVASQVLFKGSLPGLDVYITKTGLAYQLHKSENKITNNLNIEALFLNANIDFKNVEYLQLSGTNYDNYFLSNSSSGPITVKHYSKIKIKNIYAGVDWVISIDEKGIKYNFELAPNTNPDCIKIKIKGSDKTLLDTEGNLILNNKLQDIVENAPISYQAKKSIATAFVLQDSILSFKLENYNKAEKLIIDPTLSWASVFGSNNDDRILSVATDKYNNFFVTGNSKSSNFSLQNAGTYYQSSVLDNKSHSIIAKFNANLQLVWSTYYGGSISTYIGINHETGTAIEVDTSGNIFVAGIAYSTSFPIKYNSTTYIDSILNSGVASTYSDAYLLKFDNAGNRLWATLIGGSSVDFASDISLDANNNIYITGTTSSTDFPLKNLAGAYNQSSLNGGNDAFVIQFSNAGSMLYSSYLGGSSDEFGYALECDNNGTCFVTGETNSSSGFPLISSGNYFQNTINATDAFIVKLNSGNSIVWSTFLGGNANEFATSLAIDNNHNVVVMGNTNSFNFPMYNTIGYYTNTLLNAGSNNGYFDVFFARFTANGALQWTTFYGDSLDDNSNGFAFNNTYHVYHSNDNLLIDKCNNIYANFFSESKHLSKTNGICNSFNDKNLSGSSDAFFIKINRHGQLAWTTYFGSDGTESAMSIALDKNQDLFFGGITYPQKYVPVLYSNGSYYHSLPQGFDDGIIGKFKQPDLHAGVNTNYCGGGCTGAANVVVNSNCSQGAYSYLWSNGQTNTQVTGLCAGNYSVIVIDTLNTCANDTVNFIISGAHPFEIEVNTSDAICPYTCSGTATVSVPNATNATYTWDANDSTYLNYASTITNLCIGLDTVTVTIPGCGTVSEIFEIHHPDLLKAYPNVEVNSSTGSCPVICNGYIELYTTGGMQPNISCVWSNGVTGFINSTICPGDTISAVLYDSSCYTTYFNYIMPPIVPFSATIGISAAACSGSDLIVFPQNTGNLSNSVIHVLWSTGDTTNSIYNVPNGTYSCTITTPCDTITVSTNVVSNNTGNFTVNLYDGTLPNCDTGICNKSVKVIVSQNYTSIHSYVITSSLLDTAYISISNSGISTTFFKDICPNQWVKIKVLDTCTGIVKYDSIYLYPDSLTHVVFASITPTTYTCTGMCTGQAVITAYGYAPYTYLWSNGDTTNFTDNLCVGTTYYCIVHDTCSVDTFYFTMPIAPVLNIATGMAPSCPGICNGQAYVYSNYGGVPPYTYQWITGSNATTPIVNLACYDTLYTCVLTDLCNTQDTSSVTIGQAPGPIINAAPTMLSCNYNCQNSAIIMATGGYPPYNFLWSNGGTSMIAYNLCTDSTYTCIITSPGCSSDTVNFTVPHYVPMVGSITILNNSCSNICTGKAKVNVSFGSPPYSYNWSNGQTGQTAISLCAGGNSCIVTDSCGNSLTLNFSITATGMPVASSNFNVKTCKNICNGSASVFASQGMPPYSYQWLTNPIVNNAFANNLCFGNNYAVVADACLNTDTITVFIDTFTSPILAVTSNSQTCIASCSGNAVASTTLGMPPYNYAWSNNQTTNVANTLCAGSNYCIVTDACLSSDTISFVVDTIQPIYKISDSLFLSSCFNNCNGYVGVTLGGGIPPYTYVWNNTTANVAFQQNACPGVYYLTVSNPACSIDTFQYTFTLTSIFHTVSKQYTNNTCHGQCTGNAQITVAGGIAPLSYLWNNNATTSSINGLCAGIYTVIVTDANNCQLYDTIIITEPAAFADMEVIERPHCGRSDGKIFTNITGGTPPYQYFWGNLGHKDSLVNISQGLYILTIIDSNRCTFVDTFLLQDLNAQVLAGNDTTVYVPHTGVTLWASGASTYQWYPSTDLNCDTCTNPIWNGLNSIWYCVTGTDSVGCTDTACVNITIIDNCGKPAIPNAFTPNGDNKNDVFKFYGKCLIESHLKIYNRWGQLFYEGEAIEHGWDGTFKGQPAESGVYSYEGTSKNYMGKEFLLKGNVTLFR